MIRVAHWGTGPTGRMALQGILNHPDLELVGLFVARPDRAGVDAGDLCDRPVTGIKATNDVAELLGVDFDCLSYFGNGSHLDVLIQCLKAGRNVVTTSIPGLILPEQMTEAQRQPIEDTCEHGGTALFATGIEPGFASDLFPYTILTQCDEVDSVRVCEISDYSYYPVESVFRLWGFGGEPDAPVPVFGSGILPALWGPVARQMAADLGVEVDRVEVVTESSLTDHDVETACGAVKAGTVGAIRFELQGVVGERVFTVIEHVNYVDVAVAPQWCAGMTGRGSGYRVQVEGRPAIDCLMRYAFRDGESHVLIATAIRAINAITVIAEMSPGVKSPLDVPPRPPGQAARLARAAAGRS